MHRPPGETERVIRLLDGPAPIYEESAEIAYIVETATEPPPALKVVN
jgi:hypothetical protein